MFEDVKLNIYLLNYRLILHQTKRNEDITISFYFVSPHLIKLLVSR